MSERRAGLENGQCGSRPCLSLWGRPLPLDETSDSISGSAGVVATACMEEEIDGTREAPAVVGA